MAKMSRSGKRRGFLGIFGHLNVDWIKDATRDPPVEHGPFFGGVAGNIAVGAARFGVPVRLASVIGRDFPEGYLDLLNNLKVDTGFVQRNIEVETSTCWMTTYPDGHQTKQIFHGPLTGKIRFPKRFIAGLEYLHVSTGLPEACISIARQGARAGCKVALDPGADLARHYSRTDLLSALEASDMFMVNEEELGVALGLLGKRSKKALLKLVDTLIITRAEKGSLLVTRTGEKRVPAVKVPKVVDPTGAGDAYRAGLYAGLFHGYPMEGSCVLGAIAASACILCDGAQGGLQSWTELEKRYRALGRT